MILFFMKFCSYNLIVLSIRSFDPPPKHNKTSDLIGSSETSNLSKLKKTKITNKKIEDIKRIKYFDILKSILIIKSYIF